ncbi:DUF6398 domain-containing protein [Clostridium sp.]|uniref:DUF6398 domain-containing protein n=1 Tax=Clostridium sp. TaxID=1506 RepID=UPI002FCB6E8E
MEAFVTTKLNDKDKKCFLKIIDILFNSYSTTLMKGKSSAWACGIVHNICIEKKIEVRIGDIYDFFNVCSSTGLKRSKDIQKLNVLKMR